ncbi:helix-turn-helix transcriptional regulator [Pontibacter cellulosilyticus]|uniref:Helix-turn-helix transcriptional regulator n=1 Tax=Pontibacter cellulosilyticus TaxID=1720253 RepID=A0A923N6S2_9BACT|nr:helix-turn-helix transcriptional regulator [Pontibacter cellulosilyticus]MBC5991535.1 helix-turn-helix transcriptional regulator [Pontibacter cellulosilyticus]
MRLKLTEDLLQELMQVKKAEEAVQAQPMATQPIIITQCISEPYLGKMFQLYQQHEHFSVAVVEMKLENDVELTTESVMGGINMNFILSGNLFSRFSQLPHDIHLKKAEHNLLYMNNTNGYHIFQKGQPLQNLHISLSEDYFKELCPPTSKTSERLHTHILKSQPALVSDKHGYITSHMQHAIHSIACCEFKGPMQKLYMEAKVLELLALQLNQFELQQEKKIICGNADKTLAHELQLYLYQHFLAAPGLKELAKLFGTNEFRLKKVFREYVGQGIFSYAQQLRLQHARELLREGKETIAEVAEKVGYSHPNHFSTAFKKQFGYAPSAVK